MPQSCQSDSSKSIPKMCVIRYFLYAYHNINMNTHKQNHQFVFAILVYENLFISLRSPFQVLLSPCFQALLDSPETMRISIKRLYAQVLSSVAFEPSFSNEAQNSLRNKLNKNPKTNAKKNYLSEFFARMKISLSCLSDQKFLVQTFASD